MTNNMMPMIRSTASCMIACVCVIFCVAVSANAQNSDSVQNKITPTFRQSGDTLIMSNPPIWGSTLSSFWGYSPINSAAFNSVIEKNGHASVGSWMYSVGLGRSYTWNNFHVGVYGYWGVTFNNPLPSSNKRASLMSFGIDEYIGYIVAQNETFRLFPQVGLHMNWRNYTSADRSQTIDAAALQLAFPSAQSPENNLTLSSLDLAVSLGIGGDVRIPLPRLYKTEGSEAVYREDLIIGFQAGYALDPFPGRPTAWSMNGAIVNNLPALSSQGLMFRLTFTSDLHLLK